MSDEFERGEIPDDWSAALNSFTALHPEMQALRSVTYRLRLVGIAVEHVPLHTAVVSVSLWAWAVPVYGLDQEVRDARNTMMSEQDKAIELLGDQLRRLP